MNKQVPGCEISKGAGAYLLGCSYQENARACRILRQVHPAHVQVACTHSHFSLKQIIMHDSTGNVQMQGFYIS